MERWLVERESPTLQVRFRVRRMLHEEQSAHQRIRVVETVDMGRALVLDDAIQLTQRDAFVYHEMLVHVPLCAHPRPERVLIIGGGDGAAAREVLKHRAIHHIDLVEIDERVPAVSRRWFSDLAAALDHPRLHLHVMDGAAFVARAAPVYDVALVDAPDPVGPAEALFQPAFFEHLRGVLRPGGLVAVQSGSVWFQQAIGEQLFVELGRLFARVHPYTASVPAYSIGPWLFTAASTGPDPRVPDPHRAGRLMTRYYTPEVHRAAFVLPRYLASRFDGLTTATPGHPQALARSG